MDVATLLDDLGNETIRPLLRVEYDAMVDAGILDEDDRVELLQGVLVTMSPQNVPHAYAIEELTRLFAEGLRGRAILRPQLPLAATEDSEPEPDIALVPPGRYDRAHPARALLVVEVAESSLTTDRRAKARVYARADVQEYWIVNLRDRVVEVHRDPQDGAWAAITTHAADATLSPLAFPDLSIRVADILPTA